jgi:hypothetical protein
MTQNVGGVNKSLYFWGGYNKLIDLILNAQLKMAHSDLSELH